MHLPGGADLAVIFVLVLLLFGPDKLPDLARGIGRGLREVRKLTSEFQSQMSLHLDDAPRPPTPNYPPTPPQPVQAHQAPPVQSVEVVPVQDTTVAPAPPQAVSDEAAAANQRPSLT